MTTTPIPELLDIQALARQLSDTVRHIRRLVAEHRVPYLKVGHFIRFDPDDITLWLDAQRVHSRADGADRRHSAK